MLCSVFILASQYQSTEEILVPAGSWGKGLPRAPTGARAFTWSGVFYLHTPPSLPQPTLSLQTCALCL